MNEFSHFFASKKGRGLFLAREQDYSILTSRRPLFQGEEACHYQGGGQKRVCQLMCVIELSDSDGCLAVALHLAQQLEL